MKKVLYKAIILLIALLLLVGCDQEIEELPSENTSNQKDAPSDSTPEKDDVILGAVVAAPIDDAYVEACINGVWTHVGITKKGHIHFSNIEKITTYPVMLRTDKDKPSYNTKTRKVFNTELRGIMLSRDDTPYLTPITTLAADIFELNGSSVDAANKAKRIVTSLVQNTLGFRDMKPFADPLGDALLKHEVLQQTFMLVLNLGDETSSASMTNFSQKITACAERMQKDTFLGAATQSNTKLSESIAEYISHQQGDIQSRVCTLLVDPQESSAEQERKQFKNKADDILKNELHHTEVPESFLLTKILEESGVFEQLSPEIATPQQTNVIPLTFKVSLLSNKNSVHGITNKATTSPVPTFTGGFKVSEVPSKGTLNKGQLVSSNEYQKITADDTIYPNGTEFSFFFDCKTSPINSKHKITFAAADDPAVTYTITFKVRAKDDVVIKSVTSAGKPKLFIFDEYSRLTIHKGSTATIAEQQLVANVTPAYGTVTSEDMSNAVMVQFNAPKGFAFRSDSTTRATLTLSLTPTAVGDSFTFAIPSTVDLIATTDSSIGAKKISIEVLDQKTNTQLAQTSATVYFIPEGSVGRIASASITMQPSADITYTNNVADTDIVLEPFILSCELKTWYDIAEVPKDQQPDSLMIEMPTKWKLRFDHDSTEDKGFKIASTEYSNEVNIERHASSLITTPVEFAFQDFTSYEGGTDCRLTVKPFSTSDKIHLYFAFSDDEENELMASGSINLKKQQ